MRGEISLFLIVLVLIASVSAVCSEEQIDVNSASLGELEEIIGIGPVKAEAIINARPFGEVDDLINVYGIGEVTLEEIKSQGLVCIRDLSSNNEKDEEKLEDIEDNKPVSEEIEEETLKDIESETKKVAEEVPIERELISLVPKTIKTEIYNEDKGNNNYSLLYLGAFCILLTLLFVVKGRIRRKNEFR